MLLNMMALADWGTAPFSDPQIQCALVAGVLVAVIGAVVGTFVVLRGLAFIGDALAHGMLPGIAVAVTVGVNPMWGAIAAAFAMIGGISYVSTQTILSTDTAIGLLFVGMLALGVAIMTRTGSDEHELIDILFGDILAASGNDIIILAVTAVCIIVVVRILYRPLVLLAIDADLAASSGYRESVFHGLLMLLLAATIIVSFQAVGTLLVFAMILAPAATSALIARRVPTIMLAASLIGALSVFFGLLASWHLELAAAATIAVIEVLVFFAVAIVSNLCPSLQYSPAPTPGVEI